MLSPGSLLLLRALLLAFPGMLRLTLALRSFKKLSRHQVLRFFDSVLVPH